MYSVSLVCVLREGLRGQSVHISSSSYCVMTGSPLKYQHGAGDIGHLVIMTFSFYLYCPCIIGSIRAEIIDSPFMLMLWIWSVDKQILNNVVFWA